MRPVSSEPQCLAAGYILLISSASCDSIQNISQHPQPHMLPSIADGTSRQKNRLGHQNSTMSGRRTFRMDKPTRKPGNCNHPPVPLPKLANIPKVTVKGTLLVHVPYPVLRRYSEQHRTTPATMCASRQFQAI